MFLLFISSYNKQTNAIDGSRVSPFDKLKAELLYPERTDNIATKALDTKIDVEMVSCILTEIQNAKKATSDYISSGEGKFSWGYTTQEQHQACIVMMASKDPSENPLAQVTRKPQSFGCVLGINVASVGHASCSSGYYEVVGAFHKLTDEMRE